MGINNIMGMEEKVIEVTMMEDLKINVEGFRETKEIITISNWYNHK
jgi:hypothetical protein